MSSAAIQSRTTFEQVREQVRTDDQGKWDIVAPRKDLVLRNGELAIPLDESSDHVERLVPTSWATGQLCQRLGIPTAYFRRCPAVLQDMQFNFWGRQSQEDNGLHEDGSSQHGGEPERWLLRAKYGTLRGVLSERYSKLDNEMLLSSVQQVLDGASANRFDISWFALGDESLHLRLVDPTVTREALPDDRLMAGVHVANSEIGKRAVTVDAMVWRLVCSNGLIRLVKGKSLLYQRHIHLPQERFAGALESAVEQALIAATGFMEQLIVATHEPVKDVEDTLKKIAERWNLTQQTQEQARRSLLAERVGQQETLYGVVNALTNAAQLLPADHRYDVEVLAGHLLEHGISKSLSLKGSARRMATGSEMMEATGGQALHEPAVNGGSTGHASYLLNGHRSVPAPVP
jgi:hypothetical protein